MFHCPLSHHQFAQQNPTNSNKYQTQSHHALRKETTTSEEDEADQSDVSLDDQSKAPSKTESTFVPWYLQVSSSSQSNTSNPLNDRQRLPDLPEDAPPILSPLVNYLFDDAGLDDLSIIDLRDLDPPPALGANLIMMLGTARSIKHRNVSADRFCRWLRSEHKLRPYADGLLGRNELKIKLRRRAKRAKLASSVGRQLDDTNRDDGITTGWICVNVGTVSHSEEQVNESIVTEENGRGFVGFGTRERGPRVVVQMFTEEKRAELDLEGLWDRRITKRSGWEEKGVEDIEAEVVQDLENVFDKSPVNVMEDMNPAPAELRETRFTE